MFKVGDKVRICSDIKFEDKIAKYAGKEVTIVAEYDGDPNWYKIDLDYGEWVWNKNLFEPIEFISKDEFERFIRN